MTRLRMNFSRGEPVKYLGHLDLMRLWERAIRRADLPLAYTQGFTPRPKLSFAAPLPVGVTSDAELLDLTLTEPLTPEVLIDRIVPCLPGGVGVRSVDALPDQGRALPALVVAVEYLVDLWTDETPETIQSRIQDLLSARSIIRRREHGERVRPYDLRPMILELGYQNAVDRGHRLEMKLYLGQDGGGRPDEVVAALGYLNRPGRIHRTRIWLQGDEAIGA